MADQDGSRHQFEEAAATVAAEAAFTDIRDRMARVLLHERLVTRDRRAAKVTDRDGFALQKGRSVHAANLSLPASRRNRAHHVEQGLAARAASTLDRAQTPIGHAG